MNDFSSAETTSNIVTKLAPPATVSMVSIAGYPVSNIVLWITLVYTFLMCSHKIWQILRDIRRGDPGE